MDFPRTLSLLRREKGVSQKDAATELGVSQALLSHYERGLREPGLKFVARAADYYGVSADFLLGRTQTRDGSDVDPTQFFDASASNDNRLRGSAAAMFSKKVLANAMSVVFDIIGKSNSRELINKAYSILGGTIYAMFREIYERVGSAPDKFFALDRRDARRIFVANQQIMRGQYEQELDRRENAIEPLSHDALVSDYPQTATSLLSVIHSAEEEAIKLRDLLETNE